MFKYVLLSSTMQSSMQRFLIQGTSYTAVASKLPKKSTAYNNYVVYLVMFIAASAINNLTKMSFSIFHVVDFIGQTPMSSNLFLCDAFNCVAGNTLDLRAT